MKRSVWLSWMAIGAATLLHADTAGVVGRSDIVLERANTKPEEAMPLGNGRLGVALWAAEGMTIQLNRSDTLPRRLSPGQVVLPGLASLVKAADYAGRVDLFHGEFRESGAGLKVSVWLEPERDVVVVDVHGASSANRQTVLLRLWSPRKPRLEKTDTFAVLSESWKDDTLPGASGETFGSLSAVTVRGRDVHVSERNPLEAELSFLPAEDGSFRVWIAAPRWKGGDSIGLTRQLFAQAKTLDDAAHREWWNRFWQRADGMKLSSADLAAEYFENLRALNLFLSAAESGDQFPGSQAGVADLFSPAGDFHQWDPSAYWHWNLRMYVAANLGSGVPDLNAPYFRLYKDNLANIERWTRERMKNRPGVCVPETMRFNGAGLEYETWTKAVGRDCDAGSPPYYNARTLSTGAEISIWIWNQFHQTDDLAFLAANYPVMADSARFLLAYAKPGSDDTLHTFPSNAHETQWDVHDPITDIAAMKALFPLFLDAAKILNRDDELVRQVRIAVAKIRPFPLDGAKGDDVLGMSYDPHAEIHNTENLGLEPVWPYGLIGPGNELAIRTYQRRPNKFQNDWSYDALDAAHLGLANEMKAALRAITEKYQEFPSGLAKFVGPELYREQIGVVAAALQDALAHEFAGTIEVAPAWPEDWSAAANVSLPHNSTIYLDMRDGKVQTAIYKAGFSGTIHYHLPHADAVALSVKRDESYNLLDARAKAAIPAIDGATAEHPKQLGSRSIGLVR